jgi:hemoglobin
MRGPSRLAAAVLPALLARTVWARTVWATALSTTLWASVALAQTGPPPFAGDDMFQAFHGQAGVDRVVDDLIDRGLKDPRMAPSLRANDLNRLRQTLKDQFCHVLGGGCAAAGPDLSFSTGGREPTYADFAALVEHLQGAMTREGVAPRVQNRLLARLAPTRRD